jgi:hypothetical protein
MAQPIHTVDSPFPYDVDIGMVKINAKLESIMDPTDSLEANNIGAIMSAAVHQPLVEIQVVDTIGTALFYSKGMFTSIQGNVSNGGLGAWNATFVGLAYQHFVSQQFIPYNGVSAALSQILGSLKGLASDLSGGIL